MMTFLPRPFGNPTLKVKGNYGFEMVIQLGIYCYLSIEGFSAEIHFIETFGIVQTEIYFSMIILLLMEKYFPKICFSFIILLKKVIET